MQVQRRSKALTMASLEKSEPKARMGRALRLDSAPTLTGGQLRLLVHRGAGDRFAAIWPLQLGEKLKEGGP